MKTMLLVTKRKSVQEMYQAELEKVFGGRLRILPCVHPDDGMDFSSESGIAQADIVLITNPYSFPWARRQMRPDAQIINLNFSFAREKLEALKRFPVGTEALACFNFYSSAHQAVYALYEAGVTNLNLYVHYPGNPNLKGKHVDLAIISGVTDDIPPDIPQIFDMGPRKISLTSLLGIAVKANSRDDELQRSIARYSEAIATPDSYLSYFYDISSATALQLKAIMECIDYGILIYDQQGDIISFNQSFTGFLGGSVDLYNTGLRDLPWESELSQVLFTGEEFRNRLFTLRGSGRSVSVSKERINKGDPRKRLYILLIKDVTEITALEASLRRQIAKRGHVARYTFSDIKGSSPAYLRCIRKAERIAQIDKPTLIIGESGTGKELFAQSIHNASARSRFPFVAMNCAAIPASLLESELFGYDEGAFTGARRGGKEGLFQLAQKGSIFLDEIGELSLPTQAKLLRVLEEKEVMKVGSGTVTGVDVRILAATNRDLEALVEKGEFRLDLYYRLNTLIINVPPLREHRSDIPVLIREFLRQERLPDCQFDPDVWDFLLHYEWKGNIRELRNCVEYMANIAGGHVTSEHLPDYILQRYAAAHAAPTPQPVRQAPELELSPGDRDAAFLILRLLRRHPACRRAILDGLEAEGLPITEYHLRSLLGQLEEQGCIAVGRGRSGCSLTRDGERLLAALQKAP